MKKNIDFFSGTILLLMASLYLNYKTVISFSSITYVYRNFDITGYAKPIHITMSIVLFLLTIICIIKAIRSKENGVDSLFNKMLIACFILYTLIAIFSLFFVRTQEEKMAMQMKNQIEEIAKSYDNTSKNKKAKQYDLNSVLAQLDYADQDEQYERKQEIISQVENSSKPEIYFSMIFTNLDYEYYSSLGYREREYYRIFLYFTIAGLYGAIKYSYNEYNRKKTMELFHDKKILQ